MSFPRSNYYLSIERQNAIIDRISFTFQQDIIDKLPLPIDGEKEEFINTFYNLTQGYKDALSETEEESKFSNDNTLILAYINNIKILCEFGKTRLEKCEALFTQVIDLIQKNQNVHLLDIYVYRVELTTEKYEKLLQTSTSHKKIFKVAEGVARLAFATPWLVFNDAFCAMEKRVFAHYPQYPLRAPRNYRRAMSCIQGDSYSTQTDMFISPECINGTVDREGNIKLKNEKFVNSTTPCVIYVVDANDPQTVLSRGLTYDDSSINPYGKLVYFLNLQAAYEYVRNQLEQAVPFFDNLCGWSQDHPWTQESLTGTKEKVRAAFRSNGLFPTSIHQIVEAYLGIELPEPAAPKAKRW